MPSPPSRHQKNGYTAKHAMKLFSSAACWRRDKNVVHDVVAQDRKQLAYVDVALKADAEFMYSLICRDWKTIAHAAPGLKADATFMLDAV